MASYEIQNGAFVPMMQGSLDNYVSNVPFHSNGGAETLQTYPRASAVMPMFKRPRPNARHLGVVPPIAVATGVGAAMGGLVALVKNALDDDWSDTQVFTSNARAIHTGMLGIQCVIGGATRGAPIIDTLGNTVCDGGTGAACKLPASMLTEWRSLRDGFASFWSSVSDKFTSPNNAEASQLKSYATQFYNFYLRVADTCRRQGIGLPAAPLPPELAARYEAPAPGWLKWSVGGLGVIAVIVAIRTFARK